MSPDGVTRRRFLGVAGAAGAVALSGCVLSLSGERATEQATHTYALDGATALGVRNENGTVAVRGTDRADVQVRVTKRGASDRQLEDVRLETAREDGRLVVRARNGSTGVLGGLFSDPAAVHLDVRVPADLAVARLETTNGDVRLREAAGDARLETTNGDAEAVSVDGHVALSSSNGDAVARDVRGVTGASTANGEVDVAFRELRGDTTLDSSNGDVRATVPRDLDATVELSTSNGDVTVRNLQVSGSYDANSVEGQLGDGGPLLRLETANGDAVLEGRPT